MDKAQIGVVGMAVMGKNLALNIESRGYTVAIYNRTGSKTEQVVSDHPDKKLVPSYTIEDFVNSLEKPRRIILMVKAGAPTDATIKSLLPYLDKGDVLIDGGILSLKIRCDATHNLMILISTLSVWVFLVVKKVLWKDLL